MKTYILVDFLNMAFRAKNSVNPSSPLDMQIGMSMHVLFQSVNKVWKQFNADHVVFCSEGRSWRKDVYPGYKLNRKVAQASKSEREKENDQVFFESINDMFHFLNDQTNSTVLQHPKLEADDLIAFWIQQHPNDQHIIISSDSDFIQLLAPNVRIYNGITRQTISLDSVLDDKGKPVIDTKTKQPKQVPDPRYALFMKCIRGDTSDNIFPAYPGVREKGTKNKVGILEAFNDNAKGFAWNTFMLARWVDEENVEHRVRDKYEFNKLLIDLTQQPDEIKQFGSETIEAAKSKPPVKMVGAQFLKFCGRHALKRLADYPEDYATIFSARLTND